MSERILFYSPYGEWYLHTLYELTVGHALQLRGAEVKFVGCNAVFSDCDQHWKTASPRTSQSCRICQEYQNKIFDNLQMPVHWLGINLHEEDYVQAEEWLNSISDADLKSATFEGNKLGEWAESSVHSFFRMKDLDFNNQEIVQTYRSFLKSSFLALKGLRRIFDEFKPTTVMMLNGRFFSHRIAFELARKRGIRVYTHERGRTDNTLRIYKDETFLTFNTLSTSWEQWKDIPLNIDQMHQVENVIEERSKGINTGWRSFVNAQRSAWETFFKKIGVKPGTRVVALFTSSDDEAGVSKAWLPHIIDQYDWIKRTIAFYENQKDTVLIIRVHPNTIGYTGTNEQFLNKVILLKKSLPANVRIVMPSEDINSYQIIEISDLVLTYFSSLSLEATLRGIPAVVCSKGLFYQKGFANSLDNESNYESMLKQTQDHGLMEEQFTAAYRYAYHYLIRQSIPFGKVETIQVHHGRITYNDVNDLLPGKDADLDRICMAILNGESVIPSPGEKPSAEEEQRYLSDRLKDLHRLRQTNLATLKKEKIEVNFQPYKNTVNPKVSVVIPCYNYAKYLRECVESVVFQTFQDFEIIIVNDGSPDNTIEVAEQLIADYPNDRIILINQENTGQPAIARNNGIKQSGGQFILPLDADDKLDPTFLEKTVRVLLENPEIDMVYTDRMDFGKVTGLVQALDFNPKLLPYQNHMSYCTLYRREVWEEVGGYRENVRAVEDWDFFVAASVLGKKGYRIPEPLFLYRNNESGLYQEAVQKAAQKHARIMLNNPQAYKASELEEARRILGVRDSEPLVSVIIPTFNRRDLLPETIRSVLSQTYQNLEILIINDAGENVGDVIENIGDKRLRYIQHEQNRGLAATRNTGLKHATGKYIAYLDDDDKLYPNHVSLLVSFLENNPYSVAYADAYQVTYDADGKVTDKSVPLSYDFNVDILLVRNITPVQGVIHERQCIEKAGMFDETLRTHEDWDFWIRLAQHYPFYHIKQVTSEFRRDVHQNTMTSDRIFDFYNSMKHIHSKYAHLAFDKAGVQSAQQGELAAVRTMMLEAAVQYIELQKKEAGKWSFIEQERTYKTLIEKAPYLGFGYNQLGTLYFEQNPSMAKELFRKAVEKNPDQINYSVNYISALAVLGEMEEAKQKLNEQLKRSPGNQKLRQLQNQLQGQSVQARRSPKNEHIIPPSTSSATQVSIIMPVFNKIEFTQKCLDSIFVHTEGTDYEIIVIDNASSDETETILTELASENNRIRYIHNNENLGFARACNQGAQLANSELLLFLNNDMEVKPNWLPPLLQEFSGNENVGIAGSLLLYPDNTVQHNGIIIINDPYMNHPLSPWHYQINTPLEKADLNRRKVKGVTGACLMIRKSLFNAVKGFDEKFYNGYEDVDLNYKVIQKGYDVVVVPDSQLIHYESKSGKERFKMEADNFNYLKKKWSGKLTAEYIRADTDHLEPFNYASIIIVTYNSAKTLKSCLESVITTLRPHDEIILVDNASKDETVSLARSVIGSNARCKIIELEENVGFTRGTNIGIEHSENPYVVFLNPDTIVTSKWLDKLIPTLWDYKNAAVGPISNYAAGLQNAEAYLKEPFNERMTIPQIGSQFEEWYGQTLVESQLLTGFCLVVRRDVLNTLGQLDERLFLGNDDLELSWRLRVNGFKLLVHPGTFIYHEGQVSFKTDKKSVTDELVQQSTDALMQILINHYGKGRVPTPEEIWGMNWFKPSDPDFNADSRLMDVRSVPNLSNERPAGTEEKTVSIVMLTFNQLDITRQCINSVFQYTRSPFELIIIDNHSTDGTVDYLKTLGEKYDNVKLILNSENKGFPHGCNQGMEIATGDFILLLNNDVVVTEQWLERLLQAFEKDPQLGIVGPVTNAISGPQMLQHVDYTNLDDLGLFAQKVRSENNGKLMYFPRIVGFAMLMKRAVYEKLGPLEESFGSGNYEDDDYCLRAELAGYKAAIVMDCFVHHYGSASFRQDGQEAYLDTLEKNADLFYRKWKDLSPKADMWFIYLLSRARDEKAKNNMPGALQFYAEAFQVRSNDKSMVEEYAALLEESADVDTLVKVMSTYCESGKDDDAWNYLGSIYWQIGKAEEARNAFRKAVALAPTNTTYLMNLADAEYLLENFEAAMKLYAMVMQLEPEHADAAQKLAHIYLESGDASQASVILSTVVQQTGNAELQHYLELIDKPKLFLAYSFVKQGNLEYAFEYVNQYVHDTPEDVEALLLRASILNHAGHTAEALEEYKKLAERNPENDEAVYYMMDILVQENKLDELLECFRKFKDSIQASADLSAKRIESLFALGEQDEGLQAIDDYIGRYPDDYYGYFVMGNLYEQSGEIQKAVLFYDKTMGCQPPEEVLNHIQKFISELNPEELKN